MHHALKCENSRTNLHDDIDGASKLCVLRGGHCGGDGLLAVTCADQAAVIFWRGGSLFGFTGLEVAALHGDGHVP